MSAGTSIPISDLSIHFPLTREDVDSAASMSVLVAFQSTSLSRGKTDVTNEPDSNDYFQSTSLSRGKTASGTGGIRGRNLSIHFPLTREDTGSILSLRIVFPFNPLPSHEGRPVTPAAPMSSATFQSTSLSRGKTGNCQGNRSNDCFQSTSLSRGKTVLAERICREPLPFNPLPSHEGRQENVM